VDPDEVELEGLAAGVPALAEVKIADMILLKILMIRSPCAVRLKRGVRFCALDILVGIENSHGNRMTFGGLANNERPQL
jgi:hypothetical protein